MKKILLILTLSLLFIGCSQTEPTKVIEVKEKKKISDMILKIPINFKDSGYSNFETKLITNQEQLDKFISNVKSQKGWKRKENFLNSIEREEIDFKNDNLLIYRLTESSNSIVLAVDVPTSIGKQITVIVGKEKLKEEKLKEIKTDKITHYALAYKVDKTAKEITFSDGDDNTTIENKN